MGVVDVLNSVQPFYYIIFNMQSQLFEIKTQIWMEVLNHLNSILTFDSYDELKESVAHYQRPNFVQLYKRDARTIEAMKKRAPNKNY